MTPEQRILVTALPVAAFFIGIAVSSIWRAYWQSKKRKVQRQDEIEERLRILEYEMRRIKNSPLDAPPRDK